MKWLRDHDPGLTALRRAGRAALLMPATFAFGDKVIGNPALATFAAFGSFAMLVLVDFAGSIRERLEAQAALAVAGAVLVCLGTLASRSTLVAAVSMTAVAFAVLFAGVVSSVLAGATTSLLLAFILPVSIKAPPSQIPDRLAGWGLAAVVSLFAISLLWPAPARNPLRDAAVVACRALAARLRADVAYVLGTASHAQHDAAVVEADHAVTTLSEVFFATPYRPTGLSTPARTVVRLVDELRWLHAIVAHGAPPPGAASAHRRACEAKAAVAHVLELAADRLESPDRDPRELRAAQAELAATLSALEERAMEELPRIHSDPSMREIVSALDPSFRAQEIGFVASQIATNVDFAAAAERRSWPDRLLGRQPQGLATTLSAAQERAGSHAAQQSVWLQNSLRGAIGLGAAVLVSQLAGVGHAFWVVLGALSVLRSSALNTGATIVRALVGTALGFVVGAALVEIVGTDTTLLWFVLPPVVLLAGLAPTAVGFASGQAAFTLTVLILFNILQPEGWRIGLVRIEDVALGCGVSLVVGLLLWPRGAGAALGRALAEAYRQSAHYLTRSVEFGMGRCDESGLSSAAPVDEAAGAAAASRRLDDTFRVYLGERAAKAMSLAEVTSLVTGVAGLRLAGDAVLDLWEGAGAADGDRSAARQELLESAERVSGWYEDFAAGLVRRSAVPEPLPMDTAADGRLVQAVGRDLLSDNGVASATGVRMIWTGDHLDAARRLQSLLVTPARAAVGTEADGDRA
ncbi:MAG TPA: FUSC family protein [Thermoleophilaceae bacterium]|nr:FUSC family protein [Thermoleophilaceae bacterium]